MLMVVSSIVETSSLGGAGTRRTQVWCGVPAICTTTTYITYIPVAFRSRCYFPPSALYGHDLRNNADAIYDLAVHHV